MTLVKAIEKAVSVLVKSGHFNEKEATAIVHKWLVRQLEEELTKLESYLS